MAPGFEANTPSSSEMASYRRVRSSSVVQPVPSVPRHPSNSGTALCSKYACFSGSASNFPCLERDTVLCDLGSLVAGEERLSILLLPWGSILVSVVEETSPHLTRGSLQGSTREVIWLRKCPPVVYVSKAGSRACGARGRCGRLKRSGLVGGG